MADAATMKPRLIPDDDLMARDNSGGIDYEPHTAQWGGGGYVQGGAKTHLSVSGGSDDTNKTREKTPFSKKV